MTPVTISTDSPERGWRPFMDWLSSQGINPSDAVSISFDPEDLAAEVVLYKNKRRERYTRQVQLTSLPPRRTDVP